MQIFSWLTEVKLADEAGEVVVLVYSRKNFFWKALCVFYNESFPIGWPTTYCTKSRQESALIELYRKDLIRIVCSRRHDPPKCGGQFDTAWNAFLINNEACPSDSLALVLRHLHLSGPAADLSVVALPITAFGMLRASRWELLCFKLICKEMGDYNGRLFHVGTGSIIEPSRNVSSFFKNGARNAKSCRVESHIYHQNFVRFFVRKFFCFFGIKY